MKGISDLYRLINSYTSRRFLACVVIVAFIPLIVFSVVANQNLQTETYASADERLSNEIDMLNTNVNNRFDAYENDIYTLMNIPLIQEMVDKRANDINATNYYNSLSTADKINGSIYPTLYKNDSTYNALLSYFLKTIKNRPDVDLIRVFYKDGNVLCGVSQSGEDTVDYKGDKSWFNDIIVKQTLNVGGVYISPLSIARQTNSPAVRYITPYDSNNTRTALLIINFKASIITDSVNNFKLGNTGVGLFLDLNYENAEGSLLGPMYLANKLQPNLVFNESMAGKIQFKASNFPSSKGIINININNVKYLASYSKVIRGSRTFVIILAWGINEINKPIQNFTNQSITLFLLLIGLVLIVGFFTTYLLVNPLYDMTEAAEKIKEGDYSARVTKKYKGEIGILSESFNEVTELITEKLIKASSKVKAMAEQLTQSVTELASSAEEINASSEEVSSIAQHLAQGAKKQATRLEDSVRQTNTVKSEFALKMDEIQETSKIIENITSQVNMLALNASIEAARAGEYGRGFAVVADNIRKLADETKHSLDKVNAIFVDLETSLRNSINSIGDGVESVLDIAEETSASSNEASAATEEQSATIEEFTATAQELSHLAQELNELTNQLTS